MFAERAVVALGQIRERKSAVQVCLRLAERTMVVVVELKWFVWEGRREMRENTQLAGWLNWPVTFHLLI